MMIDIHPAALIIGMVALVLGLVLTNGRRDR